MKSSIKKTLVILLIIAGLGFGHGKAPSIEIDLNSGNADLLLRWFDNFHNSALIDSISNDPGSQIMEDNVRQLSDASMLRSFKEELHLFSPTDTTSGSIYGTALAFQMRKQSSLLLQKLKKQQVKDSIIQRALAYIPEDYPLNTKCSIYFVLTGWKWGDAYVCNIRHQDNRYYISDEGAPSIVINLSLIAQLYGKTAEEQLSVLDGILSHELFHFLFANYKKKSPEYTSNCDTSLMGKLFDVIQNEGIAHYIDKKPLLQKDYGTDPKYTNAEKQNIDQLNDAFLQLSGNVLDEIQKQKLLTNASTGKYWTKYGSIAGMFMAFHIERKEGASALRSCIGRGALYFIKQYMDLSAREPGWPQLSTPMQRYINDRWHQREQGIKTRS